MRKLLVAAAIVAGSALLFYWLAERYEIVHRPAADAGVSGWQVADARARLAAKLARARPGSTILLTEDDLRRVLLVAIAGHEQGPRLLAVTRELDAGVEAGELRLGVSLDLAAIPTADLESGPRRMVEAAEALLKLVGKKELYCGIHGIPEARNGRVGLTPEARVRVGPLDMAVGEFLDRAELLEGEDRSERLLRRLEAELPHLSVAGVEVVDEGLRIELAPS